MKALHACIAAALLMLLAACGSKSYSVEEFTVEVYTPTYAAGFEIRGTEAGGMSLITVRNPWQAAANIEQRLLVLHAGTEAAKDFDGQIVKSPVNKIVCMSSSHIAELDAIDCAQHIAGVSGIDYISNPYINDAYKAGSVRDVGYDTNIDFELLAAMRPDIILLYGVTGENTVITGKLRELRIPYIYIGDYMEESPLGKAEWLIVAAELCGKLESGIEIFEGIAGRYLALKEDISRSLTPAADCKDSRSCSPGRPKVMLNTPYRDTWFMPSKRSYMVRLIEDAGGEYIYTKNDSDTSVAVDMEEAYMLTSSASVWLNVGPCNTLGELTSQNPKFAGVSAVGKRKVFNNNRRQTPMGGSDFWESGVVRPDIVLRDLSIIMRGDESRYDELYYYKQLK